MKKFLIPLALFLALVVFLAVGLKRDPREIPSPLINKPAPAFSLPTLEGGEPFTPESLRGKVWMFHVWATWCVARSIRCWWRLRARTQCPLWA